MRKTRQWSPYHLPRLCSSPRPSIHRDRLMLYLGAVLADNLDELKKLIKEGQSLHTPNCLDNLLRFVMEKKRVEMFDYLLSLDEIDVNFSDQFHKSLLLYLAEVCFNEYFARKLIEKGANIHATDNSGSTFLHLAVKSKCEETLCIGQLVIEMEADVNQPENLGMTPLYLACEAGRFDWVCMLLYYGADVTITPMPRSVLPVAAISHKIPEEQELQLQEILFNYTFDEEKLVIELPTLVAAMTSNTDLFPKIVENISDVDYDNTDLHYFANSLIYAKLKHLRLFIEKYRYIIKDLIDNCSPLDIIIRATKLDVHGLTKLIDFFLNSEYVADFVLSTSTKNPIISNLLQVYVSEDHPVDKEAFTKTVCIMLSYGLTVTTLDLYAVYLKFGYCELFEILLHMDIIPIAHCQDLMAVLYYNPFATVDQFFDTVSMHSVLLDYYNNRKLKEIVAKSNESETLEKLKKLPQVPLLLELSRDAARKHIINYFKIKSCVQFYTVLHWLPIGETNKSILALVKKLY